MCTSKKMPAQGLVIIIKDKQPLMKIIAGSDDDRLNEFLEKVKEPRSESTNNFF
jgi:hypothetical protein